MSKKGLMICAGICAFAALLGVVAIVLGILQSRHTRPGKQTEALTEKPTEEITLENETAAEQVIPDILEKPVLPDIQGKPTIDVEAMTRNPNAEVVDSRIEYGTKEVEGYEK